MSRTNQAAVKRVAFLAAIVGLAASGQAAESTWVGGGADNNWSTAGNWDIGVPVNNDTLRFGGEARTNNSNDLTNLLVGTGSVGLNTAITFSNNGTAGQTGQFTLSGNKLRLGGEIVATAVTSGSLTTTIALDMDMVGFRTITAGTNHNIVVAGVIGETTSNRGLNTSGAGKVILSGLNTFSGLLRVESGTTQVNTLLNSGVASSAGTGSVIQLGRTGNATGTLEYTGTATSTNRQIAVGNNGTGVQNSRIENNGTGTLTLTSGTFNIALTAANNLSTRMLALGGTNNGVIEGVIQNNNEFGGTLALTKDGAGSWTLSGSNTYTGTTAINQGTLQIGSGGTTGALSSSSTITGSTGATLAFNRSNTITQGTDFNSVIGGGINVRQLGSGTLVLDGANTYTGTTSVNAGTLALTSLGSFANSSSIIVGDAGSSAAVLDLTAKAGGFSIGADQLLGGGGTVRLASSGTLNVLGTFSPGNSPGLFTYDGGTTVLSGTTLMEILGTSRATSPSHGAGFYDAVDVVNNGILQFGGNLTLEFSSLFGDNTAFDLFTPATGSSLAGNFTGVTVVGGFYTGLDWNLTGSTWKSSNTAGGQSLEFSSVTGQLVIVVPEPGTWALAGLGMAIAAGAAVRRRRRRLAGA